MTFRQSTYTIIENLNRIGTGPVFPGLTSSADSGSAMRNCTFILSNMTYMFHNVTNVFEIGSGTGHHACIYGAEFPHLQWQTSDAIADYRTAINDTIIKVQAPSNVLKPVEFNIDKHEIPKGYDAFYMSNVLHCMSSDNAEKLITQIGNCLPEEGLLVAYGPFKIKRDTYATEHNDGEKNKAFDVRLKKDNLSFGIKNLDDIDDYAKKAGMQRVECLLHDASNNYLIVYKKNKSTFFSPSSESAGSRQGMGINSGDTLDAVNTNSL